MKKLVLTTTLLLTMPAYAGLDGAEVTLRTIVQDTPSSPPIITSVERPVMAGPGIEYLHVADLFNPITEAQPGFVPNLVDVAIDIANDHINIDFKNSAPFAQFGAGFQNTYIFRFDSEIARSIAAAEIDNSVTTLGLQPSDVHLAGDELFINVENLKFNPSTFARVNLLVEEGPLSPAPEPETYAMMLAGLVLIGWAGIRRRRLDSAGAIY